MKFSIFLATALLVAFFTFTSSLNAQTYIAATPDNYTGLTQQAEKLRQKNNLTAENAVLLIVDHQTGLIPGVTDINPHEYKQKLMALAEIGKVFNLPTILTTSREIGVNGFLIPELQEILPDAPVIRRPGMINAYAYEPVRKAIEATGRKKVIIAAITLETCVLFPATDMLDDGYEVYPVLDASGSWSKYDFEAASQRLSRLGANLTSVFSVLCELQYDWRMPTAQQAGAIFKKYLPQYSYSIDAYINYISERYKKVPEEWGERAENK
ncbi:MAG: isochorismatase family protein [Bacteroidota bacterium]